MGEKYKKGSVIKVIGRIVIGIIVMLLGLFKLLYALFILPICEEDEDRE